MPKRKKLPKRPFIFPTKGKTARYPYSVDYNDGGRSRTKHFPTRKAGTTWGANFLVRSKKRGKTSARYDVRKRSVWTGGA